MHISQFIHNKTATIIESQPARNKQKTSKQTELSSDHWNETQQNST